MFDTDGSGAIGNEELKQAMISIGLHANKAEIDNVIKEAIPLLFLHRNMGCSWSCVRRFFGRSAPVSRRSSMSSVSSSSSPELYKKRYRFSYNQQYDQVDADGNGEIDFEEFCACMKKSQNIVKSTNEELIRECFEIFDQDRNGIITENEFKYIAKEFGDYDDELAEKVFRELDVSSNGHLSADQFATIVEDYLLSDPVKYETDGADSDVERYDERRDDRASPMPNHLPTVQE
ncbi:unnamed protein product [Caenorhabditis nigoni]